MPFDAPIHDCVVCIPARNEAKHLPSLLRSLAAQDFMRNGHLLKVVVVSNNCGDETTDVVHAASVAYGAKLDLRLIDVDLPPAHAHVGTARRMAMDAAADWLEAIGATNGIILTTDADAIAPPDWVSANLDALNETDVVGGRLIITSEDDGNPALLDLHRRIEAYWVAVRGLEDVIDPPPEDPAPRHGNHTAASLALHLATYRKVGGLPPIASGEDNALVTAIRRIGGRVRHAPTVSILVSARENGRAQNGMASEMTRRRGAVESKASYMVPAASVWREKLRMRAQLRARWTTRQERQSLGPPTDLPDIDPCVFVNVVAYIAHCEALSAQSVETEPLDEAIAKLDAMQRDRSVLALDAAE